MNEIKPKLIVIVGPTASGKSDLAIRLARKYDGEIISADSRQVYRGMDIGTGKVSKREQRLVSHHLIDVADPKRQFSVADFKLSAERALKDILRRDKLPIIVGGTGFYVDALVYDLDLPEVPPDHKLRAKLEKQTTEQLFKLLSTLDPRRAKTIEPENKRRLIRALEIIESEGSVPVLKNKRTKYDILWLGLNLKNLEKRISDRLDRRLRQGMVAEVKSLSKKIPLKRLRNFGLEYRWVSDHLNGKLTKEQMITGLRTAIRQYAKRQMTWFNRNKKIAWVPDPGAAERLARSFSSTSQSLNSER